MHASRLVVQGCFFVVLLCSGGAAAAEAVIEDAVDADAAVTFERDIHPIMRAKCMDCHGGDRVEAGLDVRLRHLMIAGGDSGSALSPGEPDESLMMQKIHAGEMPADQRELSDEQVQTLERWIAMGAPTARPEPATLKGGLRILPEDREHWAYQPIRRPEPPQPDTSRVRTPIDAFVHEALEAQGLSFSDDADRATLARRLHLDITGLPPDAALVDRFVADDEPGAWQRLLDEVLASPHYGERWGRHWLDVAGYSDSEGYAEADAVREHAWRYRDYVIQSFNDDKPFDQFIVEQLAGDELAGVIEGDMTEQQIEQLTATGFLRMAADGTGDRGVNQVEARNQVVTDTIEIISSSLLGMTVQCAQCHDHLTDAIRQKDYYSLRAVFEPALNVENWRNPTQRRVSLYTQADREEAAEIEARAQDVMEQRQAKADEFIAEVLERVLEEEEVEEELHQPLRDAHGTPRGERDDEQQDLLRRHPRIRDLDINRLYQYDQEMADKLAEYVEKAEEIRAEKPDEGFLRALTEQPGQVPTTYLFHRGDPGSPTDPTPPGVLPVLAPPDDVPEIYENDPDRPTTGRRLAYARWLTSGEHPLVARVLVNRIWMHYFGRGLVNTPDDFGTHGERPSHPELLDWLAYEFMSSGWSLKHMHRLILSSTVYRQDSFGRESHYESIDPENIYYWHMPVRRLEGETVRDAVMAASGKLTPRMHGPPVAIAQDDVGQVVVGDEVLGSANVFLRVDSLGAEDYRRSVYLQSRRTQPVTFLSTFDTPVMQINCVRRDVSTDVNQALMMMNNDWVRDQAAAMAARVRERAPEGDIAAKVRHGWRLAFGRSPEPNEAEHAEQFLAQQQAYLAEQSAEPAEALTNFCQMLMSSNQFLYID